MPEEHTHEVAEKTAADGTRTRTEMTTQNGETVERRVEQDGEPKQLQPDGR